MNRISALGLDVGDRRIGVAGCDGTGLIATGLGVIHRQRQISADIAELQDWIEQRQAQTLVVGLPLHKDGSEGAQARKVRRFIRAIQHRITLPVVFVNEYLSTVQASWDLQASGVKAPERRRVIDQQAAAVILQEWLDEQQQPKTDLKAQSNESD